MTIWFQAKNVKHTFELTFDMIKLMCKHVNIMRKVSE